MNIVAGRLVRDAKRRLGCLVVMGGPHATALPRTTLLSLPALDAVIVGEGEIPLLALANEFSARGSVDLDKIPGAAFIKKGRYKANPLPGMIADIDALPYPARDLLDMKLYGTHLLSDLEPHWRRGRDAAGTEKPRWSIDSRGVRKNAILISSRGCPSQCTFCANVCMGHKFRAHSPGYVVGEMEHLVKKYGVNHFQIADDCFTADPGRVSAICDLIIKKKLDITWDAAGRVNNLYDGSLLNKMKKSGCILMLLGIETGEQRLMNLMKKGITLEMAEKCCALLRRHGIAYMNSFIFGNEGDTEETVSATVNFAKKLGSELVVYMVLVPYPGTRLFDKFFKEYDRPDTDWSHWTSCGPDRPYEPRQMALSNGRLLELMAQASGYYDTSGSILVSQATFKVDQDA